MKTFRESDSAATSSHPPPTMVERLARFVVRARWEQLSESAREDLKARVLDSLGCAIAAQGAAPARSVRSMVDQFGGTPLCTLIGGGRSAPDRTALYNGTLVRYLDFNDSYLAPGETCHPSDNLAPVLAAAEYVGHSGKDFLTSLAVAYQVQCRLSDVAPVRAKGFDHTTQGAYAAAAGVSHALGLDEAAVANAVSIAGTALNALRVTRTGKLSQWKGLAYPHTAFAATHATFLAASGITGPLEVFEGNKGFMDTISGPFDIDWEREDLERVTRTILKKYNAEVHSQSALEGILELQARENFAPQDIEHVRIEIFDVAYNIIGGGEEGSKTEVHIKEQADHSLPYMVAVALLDGNVLPAQYEPERILRSDVQSLLRRIEVVAAEDLSRRFPDEHPCRLSVQLRDGRRLAHEKHDYEGFHSRRMSQATLLRKFNQLTAPYLDRLSRDRIIEAVSRLDRIGVRDLCALLAKVPTTPQS